MIKRNGDEQGSTGTRARLKALVKYAAATTSSTCGSRCTGYAPAQDVKADHDANRPRAAMRSANLPVDDKSIARWMRMRRLTGPTQPVVCSAAAVSAMHHGPRSLQPSCTSVC